MNNLGISTDDLSREEVKYPILGAIVGFIFMRNIWGILAGAQLGDFMAKKKIEVDALNQLGPGAHLPPAPAMSPIPGMQGYQQIDGSLLDRLRADGAFAQHPIHAYDPADYPIQSHDPLPF